MDWFFDGANALFAAVSDSSIGTVAISFISACVGASIAGWVSMRVAARNADAMQKVAQLNADNAHRLELAKARWSSIEKLGVEFIETADHVLMFLISDQKFFNAGTAEEIESYNSELKKLPDIPTMAARLRNFAARAKLLDLECEVHLNEYLAHF